VDILDLVNLLQNWGTTDPQTNLDGKGKVDIFDLIILLQKWGECSGCITSYYFESGWETVLGSSRVAVTDGGKWSDYYPDSFNNKVSVEVVNSYPKEGNGASGNVLRFHWLPTTPDSSAFVEYSGSFPNPVYFRFYFYSEHPNEYPGAGGRKFLIFRNSLYGTSGASLYLYESGLDPNKVWLHVKSHAGKIDSRYNTPDAEHLDPDFPWPGQQSKGILEPNRWHCVEFAYFRDQENGWIKAWLNNKLVINASKEAWGVSSYNTDPGYPEDFLQIPSYRNGGVETEHYEYLDNFIISSERVGC
jgi:hypothetical protein